MTKLTESTIEDFPIKLFKRLGYDTIHAPGMDTPERCCYDELAG